MPYFNYHSNIKKKIKENKDFQAFIVDNYNGISPCLLIKIDTKYYPIREHRWQEYFDIANRNNVIIQDKRT